MKNDQKNFLILLKEHSVRKRLEIAVCLFAVVMVVAVFWTLRISGLTLEEEDSGSATYTDASASENATGTDASVNETAAGTDGTEDDSDPDTTTESDGNAGISLATEEWGTLVIGSYLTSAGSGVLDATSGSTYYVADAVALDAVDTTGATDYIIYTEIDGDYYVLDANGRLRKVNDLSGNGLSVSWAADDNPEYYSWNVTEDSGAYTVYNETYTQYLSPSYEPISGTGSDVTIGTGFSASTGSLTLSGDFELAYTFSNKSNATDSTSNWLNYIIEMQATDTNGVTYLDLRADNYGWIATPDYTIYSNGDIYIGGVLSTDYPTGSSNDTVTFGTGADDWETWLETMKEGADVTVNIVKSGKYVYVTMTAAGSTFTATAYVEEFEDADVTVYITGEICQISDVSYTYNYIAADENDEVSSYVSGALDDLSLTTAFGSHTTDLALTGDFVLEYSFINTGDTEDSGEDFNNYIVEMRDANYVYLDVRSDNDGWLANQDTAKDTLAFGNDLTDENGSGSTDDEWAAWMSAMKSGQEVSVRVERIGGYVTITTIAAGATFTATAYVSEYADGRTLYIHLTGEQCDLTDITYTYYTPVSSRTSVSVGTLELTADASGYAWTATAALSSNLRSGSYTLLAQTTTGYVEWLNSSDDTDYLLCLESSSPSTTGITFRFAQARVCKVYFDGTNGGGTVYREKTTGINQVEVVSYEMDDTGKYFSITVPSLDYTIYNNNYYEFELAGWYDIYNTASDSEATSLSGISTIINENYYLPGNTMTLAYDPDSDNATTTVCYADYIGTTYDAAIDSSTGKAYSADLVSDRTTSSLEGGVNTGNFITTRLYDYSDLYNLYSSYIDTTSTKTVSDVDYTTYKSLSGHTEIWQLGSVIGGTSLGNSIFGSGISHGFIFFNNTTNQFRSLFYLSRDTNYGRFNGGNNYVRASGITTTLGDLGVDLRTILFPDNTASGGYAWHNMSSTNGSIVDTVNTDGTLGTTYVGQGNYLYQYDDDTGYYYYDAAKNAASYSITNQRFYLYDYTVRMWKDKSTSTSDFLPYNYASASLTDSDGNKYGQINYTDINYAFGMSSEIEFSLPDDVPYEGQTLTDKVNQALERNMKFCFIGDDDLWVYIDEGEDDEQLLLDIGGIHGEIYGEIDFSTGIIGVVEYLSDTISISADGLMTFTNGNRTYQMTDAQKTTYDSLLGTTTAAVYVLIEKTSEGLYEITDLAKSIDFVYTETYIASNSASVVESGSHVLSLYYLERGASESNLAIYFNISSETYNLKLTKWAEELSGTATGLDGAVFTYYKSTDFTEDNEVTLTDSSGNSTSSFKAGEVANGLRVGKTYYIKETTYPDGYTDNGKYLSVYLNRNGVLTINVYNSGGGDPIETYTYTYDSQNSTSEWEDTGTASTDWDYVTWLQADSTTSYMTYTVPSGEVTGYYDIGFIIQNTKAYEIPTTGNVGIFRYRNTGIILVLVSVAGLILIAFYQLVWARRLRTNEHTKGYTKDGRKREKRGKRFTRTRDHPGRRIVIRGSDVTVSLANGGMERRRATGLGKR